MSQVPSGSFGCLRRTRLPLVIGAGVSNSTASTVSMRDGQASRTLSTSQTRCCGAPISMLFSKCISGASTSVRFGEVEATQIHHLVPRSHEVTHELLLRVVRCVDLRDGSQLGVMTEDEVDGGAGPFDLARGAIATLEDVLRRGRRSEERRV